MGNTGFYDDVKNIIRHHGQEVATVNLAVTSAIAGLMYSEYLRNFKKSIRPTLKVLVPETSQISQLLSIGSPFANVMADTMVDAMVAHPLMVNRIQAKELFLFQDDYRDILKTIFEIYIIPNVARYVPSVIRQKFGLDDPSLQTFVESSELDMFNRDFPKDYHHRFIVDEAVLHLLITIPPLCSELTEITNNLEVIMPAESEEFLSIGNQQAISVIHFNKEIIENENMMELLSFVTDSNFATHHADGLDAYRIRSNVFNQLIRGRLLPIQAD